MKFIGITGGIAAGKSAVTTLLTELEFTVIDMDKVSRVVVEPGSKGLAKIIDEFGAGYLTDSGELHRKKLAELVFNDKEQLAKLDALMGPIMWDEVERQKTEIEDEIAFLDAALIFEKGMDEHLDGVLLVTAPMEVRLQRAMARDNLTRQQVEARIATQMSEEEKRERADWVIENVGTLEDLCEKVVQVLETVRKSLKP